MTVLVVPALEEEPWPTLGPAVCAWIEDNLVFGPGDLRAEPARIDDEVRGILYRAYEVHPDSGRRRFKRVALSLRKGARKTELAAWIVAAELHPEAPVRFVRWDGQGQPEGRGVTDPYIPLVAYTEEQTEDLAYGALKVILEESRVAGAFDIGWERIMRRGGDGIAKAMAAAPNARDGARTTCQHFDESHRLNLPNLVRAHRVMLANIPKRPLADPWTLETTTAYEPGAGSVAERTAHYAEAVAEGRMKDSTLFYFHRQAGPEHDIATEAGLRAAVLEASGPVVAQWSDVDAIVAQFHEPDADRAYLERVWLNRPVQGADQAFDVQAWRELARPGYEVAGGALITLGFDGSRSADSTALVGTGIVSGYQWTLGLWERPAMLRPEQPWEVPAEEVDGAVEAAFATWSVWRMYADPPYWESFIATWAGRHGKECVVEWATYRTRPMAYALKAFANAIAGGELAHAEDTAMGAHLGNAVKRRMHLKDEQGQPLWLIQKERPDSPHKIDLAMAAVLSWEARNDALTAGVGQPEPPSVYEERGILLI